VTVAHERLSRLLDALPDELEREALTHASWTRRAGDTYQRLAFLGDSVLGLAVSTDLYPRTQRDADGVPLDAGELTKIRAVAVSGAACRDVAQRLAVPERLRAAAPADGSGGVDELVASERVLASVVEALIGACYLHHGYETTAEAVVEAFAPETAAALRSPGDPKSDLQERLARRGQVVAYPVLAEDGPAHARSFRVGAQVAGSELGQGAGRSKKEAEEAAARAALQTLAGDG
jgi:ribonuclease-3